MSGWMSRAEPSALAPSAPSLLLVLQSTLDASTYARVIEILKTFDDTSPDAARIERELACALNHEPHVRAAVSAYFAGPTPPAHPTGQGARRTPPPFWRHVAWGDWNRSARAEKSPAQSNTQHELQPTTPG